MGKCAYCGAYIADSGNKQAVKSLMGSFGLDLVTDAAGALTKQYCSEKCRREAESSGGGGGGGNANSVRAAQAEAKAAQAEAKAAEAEKAKAEIEARAAHDTALKAKVDEGHRSVAAITFGDDVASIVNSLSSLLMIVNAYDPKTEYYRDDQKALKGVRSSAIDKMEMGIMLLRNKGDNTQADFFQSKLEEKDDSIGAKFKKMADPSQVASKFDDMKKSLGGLGGLFGKKK